MKQFLPLLLLAVTPASYAGGISHSISSSVQLEAVSAGSIAEKVSSSYSISGSGVTTLDSDDANSILSSESSFSFLPRALVPFIGLVETIPDSRRINLSGDADATAQP